MLLTLTTTGTPPTDLGTLLGMHSDETQTVSLPWGTAHVFFPEVGAERSTAALLVEVDPLEISEPAHHRGASAALSRYVNDRPYVASCLLSVAIGRVFSNALDGGSHDHEALAERAIPLTAALSAVPCSGGRPAIDALFAPLGYTIEAVRHPLDPRFPEWGESPLWSISIHNEVRLAELLSHLCVLVPALDDDGHDCVGFGAVAELAMPGAEWVQRHPARDRFAARRIREPRTLRGAASVRPPSDEETERRADAEEAALERGTSLDERRGRAVIGALLAARATRVLDLGCGDGNLVRALLDDNTFERVIGCDVSLGALQRAERTLRLERMPEAKRARLELILGSAVYRDPRFAEVDAICLVEVIEHIDPPRLPQLARVVFESARAHTVIVTTPNREHNVRFPALPEGRLRHRDHRFEWTRAELAAWCDGIRREHGYSATISGIGDDDDEVGPPTQMVVFTRDEARR